MKLAGEDALIVLFRSDMKKFKWFDWLIGLSPIIALLADLYFDRPITRFIFGVSLVVVIIFYRIRDHRQRKSK